MSVYFIQAGKDGPIKIGTANGVRRRMANLQSAHYEILELLGIVIGDRDVEREFHERLADSRLRGEWFRPTATVLAFIEEALKNSGTVDGDGVDDDTGQFKLRLDDETTKKVDRYARFVKETTGAELSRTETVLALVRKALDEWSDAQPAKSKR